jgi:hypothetical protein
MVLSGFMAYYAPDYLSPPTGNFAHIDQHGEEVARPSVAFGGYSDYNSPGRGIAEPAHDFAGPLVALFDHPESGDGLLGGRANDIWQTPYMSPLSNVAENEDAEYSDGSSSDVTVIRVVSDAPQSNVIGYISISPLAVDRILADLRPVVTNSFTLSAFTPMTMASTSMRSLTDRDYNPVNSGGAVEHHSDIHEYAALAHGSASDASLASTSRSTTASERSAMNAAINAALANQVAGVNSVAVRTADGSAANGQANAQSNSSSDGQQNGLLELTDAERLKLKRKLPGSIETEEATDSTSNRSEQYDEGNVQVAYDPTRPFDVNAVPQGQLRQDAAANMADDGLIEVLATDVTAIVASSDVIDMAAANRQIVTEPAVATYQAFEIVVDGDAQAAADVVADAARLAGAVALNAQPVVQAE